MIWMLVIIYKHHISTLIEMIFRTLSRRLVSLRFLTPQKRSLLVIPNYSFSRKAQKQTSTIVSSIQKEIQDESSILTDVYKFQKDVKEQGWDIAKQNTLVELTKTDGNYTIRLLSNIKSPSTLNQKQESQQEQQSKNYDMHEVTICITKVGSEKTMLINTIIAQEIQISNITFFQDYQHAKQNRLDFFNTNKYTGPDAETLSEQVLHAIYGLLQEQCGVKPQLLNSFTKYCIESEQQYYINWLKDLKSMF